MGWQVGFDQGWKRDVGYGVPSICDHPDCNEEINRGLGYACGKDVYGGEDGCGLFFCGKHQTNYMQQCERCAAGLEPFAPKTDTQEWIDWKNTDESWAQWRDDEQQRSEG